MNNSIKISMLGGDMRQLAVAQQLSEKYCNISVWGLNTASVSTAIRSIEGSISEALVGADAVILPLPASVDGITLNCPLADVSERPKLTGICDKIPAGCVVIGGRMPETFVKLAISKGFCVKDYFESEDFQIKNAYTTAEAALSIAMNTLDKNIRGSRIAITGYGRIAKHLCSLLMAIGADVTIAARRTSDLVWAESYGARTLMIAPGGEWRRELRHGYDVIYNTVPTWLFDREFLSEVDRKTFIVDLASAPGGVDIRAAKELGSNVSWATSLPGKYAPKSAGDIIAGCVDRMIAEAAL